MLRARTYRSLPILKARVKTTLKSSKQVVENMDIAKVQIISKINDKNHQTATFFHVNNELSGPIQ